MADLFEIKVPHSGSVENVEIVEWMISEGDVVAEGDSLAEVSTDKVDTELEAPKGGRVVKFLYEDGSEVPVGTVVALLADPADPEDEVAAAVDAYQPLAT